mgnify:FL=1
MFLEATEESSMLATVHLLPPNCTFVSQAVRRIDGSQDTKVNGFGAEGICLTSFVVVALPWVGGAMPMCNFWKTTCNGHIVSIRTDWKDTSAVLAAFERINRTIN